MKTVSKRLSVILLAVIMLCSFTAFLSACGSGSSSGPSGGGKSEAAVYFDGGAVARLGEYYDPEIRVAAGTTITGVKLTDANDAAIALDKSYGFTPAAYGAYYYSVTATNGLHEKTFEKTVAVRDESAPEITAMPNAKTIESGVYTDFDKDLEYVEVSVSDQSILPYITKKVIAIEKGGVEISDENGFSAYLFDEAGKYNVTVAVIAPDGKTSYEKYEITVADSAAPAMSIVGETFAWVKNGMVKLPEVRVYDVSSFTLSVSAQKGGSAVKITDGSVAAQAGDTFKITYTAKDEANNKSEAQTTLKVMQPGTLFDGSDRDFISAFTSADGFVEYAGGVNFKGDSGENSFTFGGAGFGYDLSGYKTLTINASNYGGKAISASVYAVTQSGYVKLGEGALDSGANELSVSLAGAEGISGIKITFTSTQKLWLDMQKITASDADIEAAGSAELSANAVSGIDFSKDAYYAGAQISGDYKKESVSVFGKSVSACVIGLGAGGYTSAVFKSSVSAGAVNYIEALVYAEKAGDVSLYLISGGKTLGGTFSLKRGVNAIRRYIGDSSALSVSGIRVSEASGCANEIIIKQINLYNKTSFEGGEVFKEAATNYIVAYGEDFALPWLSASQTGAVKSATVTVKKGSTALIENAAEGAVINLYSLENGGAGNYTLNYSVTDVLGGTHVKTVNLTAESKKLSVSVSMTKDYYAGEQITLPDPTVEGSLVQSVTAVNKYYRAQGGLSWKSANGGFTVGASTYVTVRYSITVKGSASVMYEYELFVHENGVNFDYELLADGTYSGDGDQYESRCPAEITSYWSHDGKNSLLYAGSKYYDACTGFVWSTPKQIGEYDAVVFWAYAEKDISDVITICVHDGNKWNENSNVKILAGEHNYVYKLERTATQITKLCFTTKRSEDFYVDSVTFVKLADVEFEQISGVLVSDEDITVQKPQIESYSAKALSKDDINNAKYTLEVKAVGFEEKPTVYAFGAGALKINLTAGAYEVTQKVVISGFEWTDLQQIKVRNVAAVFTTPQTGYNVGTQYVIKAPEIIGEGESAVHYKAKDAEQWVKAENGKITFEKAGDYQIKLSASNSKGTDEEIYNVAARGTSVIADFETDENGAYFGMSTKYEPTAWNGGVTDEWSANGSYSLKATCLMDSWWGIIYDTPITLSSPTKTFSFYFKSEVNVSGYAMEILEQSGQWCHAEFDVKKGEHLYVVEFDVEISVITKLIFRSLPAYGTFYLDGFEAKTYDYAFPASVPETVKEGDVITIGRASGTNITDESVKYRLNGSSEYTNVELSDGEFKTSIAAEGVYEFVYGLKCDGATFTKTYTITVLGKQVQFTAPVSSCTVGEEIVITAATSEDLTLLTSKLYAGKAGEELTELTVSGGVAKIGFSESGLHEVKAVATFAGGSRERTYNVWVRDKNVIADFELESDGTYHGTADPLASTYAASNGSVVNENAGDGSYALKIHRDGSDGWVGYSRTVNLSGSTDTVEFCVYSETEIPVDNSSAGNCFIIGFYEGSDWFQQKVEIKVGLNKYTVKFGRTFSKVDQYWFRLYGNGGDFYVDDIKAIVEDDDAVTELRANVIDFDLKSDGSYRGMSDKFYNNGSYMSSCGVSKDWAADGEYSLKVVGSQDSWGGLMYDTAIDLGAYYDTMTVTIKYEEASGGSHYLSSGNVFQIYLYSNDSGATGYATLNGANAWKLSSDNGGVQTFTLSLPAQTRYITGFTFVVSNGDTIYFDAITFSNSSAAE